MRTKSIFRLVDTITWLLISLAPIIYYGCLCLGHQAVIPNFAEYCDEFATYLSVGTFSGWLNDILAFINVNVGSYSVVFGWFILCQVSHFIIDILLWIFRLCHHWLNKAVDNL